MSRYLVRRVSKPSFVIRKREPFSASKNVTLIEQHPHFQLHLVTNRFVMVTTAPVVVEAATPLTMEATSPVVMVAAAPVIVRLVVVMWSSVVSVRTTTAVSVAIVTTTVVATIVRHSMTRKMVRKWPKLFQ